ncbi:MAG: hypothetical protein U0Q14_13140 [Dermatophilaceae bacterium]
MAQPSEAGVSRSVRRAQAEAARSIVVLPPSPTVLTATIGFALLVAVCVAGGAVLAAAAVALLGSVLAWGWVGLLDVPSPRGVIGVVGGTALGSAVLAAFRLDEPLLRWVPVALALGLIGAFAHQILRTDGRSRLTFGLAGTVSGVVVVGAGVPWVGVAVPTGGRWLAGMTLLGVVVAVLAELAARWPRMVPVVVLLGALVAAGLAGLVSGPVWSAWLAGMSGAAGTAGTAGAAGVAGLGAAAGPLGAAVSPGLAMELSAGAALLGAVVSQSVRRVMASAPGVGTVRAELAVAAAAVLVPAGAAYVLLRIFVA